MDNRADKIFELLKQRGISGYRLTKDLNWSRGVLQAWRSGKAKPSVEKLIEVSEYFGVPLSYFTETPPDKAAMSDAQKRRLELRKLIDELPDDKLTQASKALAIMLEVSE